LNDFKLLIVRYLHINLSRFINLLLPLPSIDNDDYYPQIYIHEYEAHKLAGRLAPPYNNKMPVVVIHSGDEKAEYTGYTLDANNNFIQLATPVNERYAELNEVWVISINETLNRGVAPTQITQEPDPNDKVVRINISPKFEKMTVKSHKESWVAGKSDVCIKAYSHFINGDDHAVPGSPNNSYRVYLTSDDAELIRKFKRKDIKNKKEQTINWVYFNTWNAFSLITNDQRGDHFFYVIFERDGWPTGFKNVTVTSTAAYSQYIEFRSADVEYAAGIITADDALSYFANIYNVDNGSIKFNSKL
jgi:hypothetical protein